MCLFERERVSGNVMLWQLTVLMFANLIINVFRLCFSNLMAKLHQNSMHWFVGNLAIFARIRVADADNFRNELWLWCWYQWSDNKGVHSVFWSFGKVWTIKWIAIVRWIEDQRVDVLVTMNVLLWQLESLLTRINSKISVLRLVHTLESQATKKSRESHAM